MKGGAGKLLIKYFIAINKFNFPKFLPYKKCRVTFYFLFKTASIFGLLFDQQQEFTENLKESRCY